MSRSKDPNYDPELAKQIKANLRHARSEPQAGDDDLTHIGGGAAGAGQLARRARLGFIGSEPFEARRPVARTYVAEYGSLAGLAVTLAGQIQLGVAIVAVCLLIGLPKAWTWANDRLGSGLWVLGAVLLIAAEIAWGGGGAARDTLSHHGSPGSAMVLTFIGGVVALLGFYRRWGTGGNVFYTARQRDPEAAAVASEAARREGYGRGDD